MKQFINKLVLTIVLLTNFIFFSQSLFAQSSFKFYDDISLPQTDAWNFVRQGEVSPSLYTGTINLSVPIYEYNYLFLPEGESTAHNLMNFGNYLWGATGYTIGFSFDILALGAHCNSLGLFNLNHNSKGYRNFTYDGHFPQPDSMDDQWSIYLGVKHAEKYGYRKLRK